MTAQLMTLTDSAATHIKGLIDTAPADGKIAGIRIGVEAAGCSGLSYSMEYAEEQAPSDLLVEDKGVKIFIDPRAQLYLVGMELDYKEDEFEAGFIFNNPNAVGHCGCGKSFHT